jgi:putative phosphoserine phosphatase / 1-acylglycerol-3-phosphate O-acyltransferase
MTEMRLDAARREVEAGERGREIGAFFDLDGTLVQGYTAAVFAQARIRNREVGVAEVARLARLGIDGLLGRAGFEDMMAVAAQSNAGRPEADVLAQAEAIFAETVSFRILAGMRDLVEAHRAKGHTVVLASSATNHQAEPVARALDIDRVICNRLTVGPDGRLTGEVAQPVIWGTGKAVAVRDLADDLGLDLARSYFYADGNEDEALMHLVGHPRPVNPRSRLEAVARRRGWPILRSTLPTSPGRQERVRNVLAIAGLLPAGSIGLSTGLARRSKRAGINAAAATWLDTLLRVNGVRVNVVAGRQHLRSPRPAVFIFNHRNNFDPFVVAYLIRHDFTSIAKKELEKDPIMGTLGRLGDIIFVDRSDTATAVEQLKGIETLAAKGLSVLVAPEGTRSADGELGPFKKGAFRIAMATGLPIIPIVIRNAEDIADRDATLLRAGTVDVAILPPIDVTAWTVAELSEHIGAVRARFEATLLRWPG